MDEFDATTLWRISDFKREREAHPETNPFAADNRPTLLPTTLLADLQQLQAMFSRSSPPASAIAKRRCSISRTASASGR